MVTLVTPTGDTGGITGVTNCAIYSALGTSVGYFRVSASGTTMTAEVFIYHG